MALMLTAILSTVPWDGDFDGKDYRVTGDMTSDSRSYTKVNENTLDFTTRKPGRSWAAAGSPSLRMGNLVPVTSWSMDAKGKKVKSIAVYNRS